MTKLSDANTRLDAAMERLGAAVADYRARVGRANGSAEENEALRAQRDKLKSDFDTLRETSVTVSSRLDAAIGRLRNMLDE